MTDSYEEPVEEPAAATEVVTLPEPTPAGDARVSVACPSCGTTGWVDYARRDASAFCTVCDYPLFWARERVSVVGDDESEGSSLRRLPGTAGRAALASLLCWHCTEPNPPTASVCLRCGADLAGPPREEPVFVPEPEPELVVTEVAPEPGFRWWPYVLASLAALLVLLVLLGVLGVY